MRGDATHVEHADAGNFMLSWKWDGTRLVIETDPLGLIPAFVYQGHREFAVSTTIPQLIAEGARLHVDRGALAVFLRLGFFVGDDTPFVEIRAVPPGARLVWEDGRLRRSGGPYVVAPSKLSRDDALDRAIGLTQRAIERRLPHAPFALPLSGGRDSRHILFSLIHSGHRPEFVVTTPRWPPAASDDLRVAAELAGMLRLPHVILKSSAAPASLEARKNVATGYCAQEHAWFFPLLDYLRDGPRLLYEGNGGALWNPGWLEQRDIRDLWRSGNTRQVASQLLDDYAVLSDAAIDGLLADPVSSGRSVAVARLSEELDRHIDAPDPGKSFHFWNRLRRTLTLIPYNQMRQFAEVHTPLVDRDLVEFLLSLEPEVTSPALVRSDKTFHSDAIRRTFPGFAHLPFEPDHGRPADVAVHNRALGMEVARYMTRRRKLFELMRNAYVWPRICYTQANPRYAERNAWFATTVLYLAQLEDVLK